MASQPRQFAGRHRIPSSFTRYEGPTWCFKFKSLLLNDAYSILRDLKSKWFGFQDFLSSPHISPDDVLNAVAVFRKLCSATTTSDLTTILCSIMMSDTFMLKGVLSCLDYLNRKNEPDNSLTFLNDLLVLLSNLQCTFPASVSGILVALLPVIKNVLANLKKSAELLTLKDGFQKLDESSKTFLKDIGLQEKSREEKLHALEPPDDFRQIPVLPLASELKFGGIPFLRPNLIKGAYRDANHYLDVQFRLLREDFVRPLREGIRKYRSYIMKGEKVPRKIENLNIYFKVSIESSSVSQKIVHAIYFDEKPFQRINWERSKRLLYGSLLILSQDNFETMIFATVHERNADDLKNGLVSVIFHPQKVDIFADEVYIMVETHTYFAAYQPQLLALQQVSSVQLPFQDYIVKGSCNVSSPKYLKEDSKYDIQAILKKTRMKFRSGENVIRPLISEDWPEEKFYSLDKSQILAVKSALTKEFCVIQGPPGTGKTFVGLKIVEILLCNQNPLRKPLCPILVVCYTNHALDQFLEGILEFTENVVRVGSRSRSERLEMHNLKRKKCRPQEMEQLSTNLEYILNTLNKDMQLLTKAQTLRCNFSDLSSFMSERTVRTFQMQLVSKENFFQHWLRIDEIKKEYEKMHMEMVSNLEEENPIIEEEEDDFDVEEYENEQLIDANEQEQNLRLEKPKVKNVAEVSWFRYLSHVCLSGIQATEMEEARIQNVWKIGTEMRWKLYRLWIHRLKEYLNIPKIKAELQEIEQQIKSADDEAKVRALRKADVVGMTTTGAATCLEVIKRVNPSIVIIEEAAEVLEAHIVACLAPETEHLILIGDHKQLRPSNSVYELSVRYKMEVSLFERMVNNNLFCCQLNIQHRMRPEFAELLVPHFYETLLNSTSVEAYENIRGMMSNMFFIDHEFPERDESETKSHSNIHEAKFLASFCEYLLNQDYKPSQITVLTTYSGQMHLIKSFMGAEKFKGVRIVVVDNFQGEENDIILLSLVRSNPQGKVGFTRVSNRICVCLSRAKKGFYCIANFAMLSKSSLVWESILKVVGDQKCLNNSFQVCCPNHVDQITSIKIPEDFAKVPEGGCGVACTYKLNCGHVCARLCHGYDLNHEKFQCIKPCLRSCSRNHQCIDVCYKECPPCNTLVEHEFGSCGHSGKYKCYRIDKITCPFPCERTLSCGHACQKLCYKFCSPCEVVVDYTPELCGHSGKYKCYSLKDFICPFPCNKALSCGHACNAKCGESCTKLCYYPCSKVLPCGHSCLLKCYMPCTLAKCKKLVSVVSKCGHSVQVVCCKSKDDGFISSNCRSPCTKTLHCGHACVQLCSKPCLCKEKCSKMLPCGHVCPKQCREPCEKHCKVEVEKTGACLHKIYRPCFQLIGLSEMDISNLCSSPCTKKLSCGHQCPKICREDCERECKVLVTLTLSCDHETQILCYLTRDTSSITCKERCSRLLSCGHKCAEHCADPCTQRCKSVVNITGSCLHDIALHCFQSKELTEDEIMKFCKNVCNKTLPCNHLCSKQCQDECEKECKAVVPKTLPCGHKKDVPCHLFEVDQFCNHRCTLLLKCGHACKGYCGEPCPNVCQVCHKALFRRLTVNSVSKILFCPQSCSHALTESWLMYAAAKASDKPICCPVCKIKITLSQRFQLPSGRNKQNAPSANGKATPRSSRKVRSASQSDGANGSRDGVQNTERGARNTTASRRNGKSTLASSSQETSRTDVKPKQQREPQQDGKASRREADQTSEVDTCSTDFKRRGKSRGRRGRGRVPVTPVWSSTGNKEYSIQNQQDRKDPQHDPNRRGERGQNLQHSEEMNSRYFQEPGNSFCRGRGVRHGSSTRGFSAPRNNRYRYWYGE